LKPKSIELSEGRRTLVKGIAPQFTISQDASMLVLRAIPLLALFATATFAQDAARLIDARPVTTER
jgi:hypothetical protein